MVFAKGIINRFFHLQPYRFADKSLLATLRKKTGYTFTNCKKALDMHNNDLEVAEKWLKEQAQSLGWIKATKLEGREATQGLIGVAVNGNNGVLVEVNCETDFVAKNQEFHKIVSITAESCLNFIQRHTGSMGVVKVGFDKDQLKTLDGPEGKSLGDHLALMIGNLGENALLRRALCLKASNDLILQGYAHPSGQENNNILLGRFGGLIILRQTGTLVENIDLLAKNLCQHIVGMNPKKIGTDLDKPANKKEDEICLIHQEYLLEEGKTVSDILQEKMVEIVDFRRFECGENLDIEFETLETCQ